MKLTNRTEYVLQALKYLAEKPPIKWASLREVAGAVGIKETLLEPIFKRLQSSGLLKAQRGWEGGFALARSPERISFLEIIAQCEGYQALVQCPFSQGCEVCQQGSVCPLGETWQTAQLMLKDAFAKTTLSDIVAIRSKETRVAKRAVNDSSNSQLKFDSDDAMEDARGFIEDGILGVSPKMRDMFLQMERAASNSMNLLLTGETGTGKTVCAKAIHQRSARKDKPFVHVPCPAIPTTMLENTLFGHKRGAYTNAISDSEGFFQKAIGGTLFLDEISDIPLDVQAKLLCAVEEKLITPVGANQPLMVDIRIIAATNASLAAKVREENFREDLFYRLNVQEIQIPPLRERKEDIPLLLRYYLSKHSEELTKHYRLSAGPEQLLVSYPFPGNVRELEHLLYKAIQKANEEELTAADFEPYLQTSPVSSSPFPPLQAALEQAERKHIQSAVLEAGGDKEKAARLLGISPATLYRKLKKYQL